jgi:rare lipoprotein A
MFSSSCASSSYVDIKAGPVGIRAALSSGFGSRRIAQGFLIIVGAASLAGCVQTHVAANKSEVVSPVRQSSQPTSRGASLTHRRVAAARKHAPAASNRKPAATEGASHGIASYYWQGTKTASGEKFNTNDLTAAHPTLPFGTRLRVTNVSSGQAVTVRVNDRGPFIRGRVVDVSYAAAEELGMVGDGVAKVKLDVVE